MKNVAIINNQAFGDCLLGTHTARLYKKYFPESYITFFTRAGLTATTAEGEALHNHIYAILAAQEHIDNIGFMDNERKLHVLKGAPPKNTFDDIILQDKYFSDLGMVKSLSYSLIEKYPEYDFSDTETKFSTSSEKTRISEGIMIATNGPLDWNRKTKNDKLRVSIFSKLKDYIIKNNINARFYFMGRDVEEHTLAESLQMLNNCDLFIGPMGMPVHAAAGLGIDTIHLTSVFPPEYDSPKFYHSGLHHAIKSKNHCLTYECVHEKLFGVEVYPEGPRTKYGFWPKYCEYTDNGKSCVYNIEADQVIEAFDNWYNEKGKYL